ncbi:MAG: helix-hairpin-helix domain-containing protein [Candidatus Nanohaloarchaea archaeon]
MAEKPKICMTVRLVVENFTLKELREASEDELMELNDVGPEVSKSITSFFMSSGEELVQDLLNEGVRPEREMTGDELAGLKLVITGSIEGVHPTGVGQVTRDTWRGCNFFGLPGNWIGDDPGDRKIEDAESLDVEKLEQSGFRDRFLDELR